MTVTSLTKRLSLIAGVYTLVLGSLAQAAEPSYCHIDNLEGRSVEYQRRAGAPNRFYAFQLGSVKVAGMAVGESDSDDVAAVAMALGRGLGSRQNYCTWYVNDGNPEARRRFNWHYLPKPSGSNYDATGDRWMDIVGDEFDHAALNFVDCAVDYGYLAMGCDGMKHRGPTLFAMMLAYSGCTPEHAAEVANRLWGNNGIKTEMRVALARRARALAEAHPDQAARLRAAFGQKRPLF
jgi:hypothetical protein